MLSVDLCWAEVIVNWPSSSKRKLFTIAAPTEHSEELESTSLTTHHQLVAIKQKENPHDIHIALSRLRKAQIPEGLAQHGKGEEIMTFT